MNSIYQDILNSKRSGQKLLAILVDPDKFILEEVDEFINKVNNSFISHIFIGGSEVEINITQRLVTAIKSKTILPLILFPGDITQICDEADALLFLSLISGRNPDYLIDKHVQAVPLLKETSLEIIPTAYILIENGKQTSVQRVSKTKPLSRIDVETIVNTAKAGELLGLRLLYLEAGSGATHPIDPHIIEEVHSQCKNPIIVGGGVRNLEQLQNAYNSGADMVVIGTAFEENKLFFDELKQRNESIS